MAKTSSIQSVDCSGIGLEKITTQLDKLTNLTRLDLSNNRLSEVPRLGRRIRSLNLSHNRLTSAKLNRIPISVQHLDLSHNQLAYLPVGLLALNQLQSLELTENSINCDCDTLHIRNWLQTKHVRSEHSVVCSGPTQVKGKPWLQVRISDLCSGSAEDIWNDEDENNIMLGDQAIFEQASEEKPSEDELGKDYLPIEKNLFKRQLDDLSNVTETFEHDDEGSGAYDGLPRIDVEAEIDASGDSDTSTPLPLARFHGVNVETTTNAEEEEGSGSDVPLVRFDTKSQEDDNSTVIITTTEADEDEQFYEPQTLGIFKDVSLHTIDDTTPITPISEAPIEKEVVEETGLSRMSNTQQASPVKNDPPTSDDTTDNAESTYILLLILGILLVGLIAFVVIRRKTANQRREADAENANGKEMLAMNKERLGKPINGNNGDRTNTNGGEIIPLIGNRDKWDSRIVPQHGLSQPDQEELRRAQEPLLKKLAEPGEYESVVEKPEPMPRTHRSSRPNSSGSNERANENNNNVENEPKPDIQVNDDPVAEDSSYAPISPKPARYSPVYSPETGRVKIKLTETQRPRTPMLVSRTRSNAGELITTPLRQPQ